MNIWLSCLDSGGNRYILRLGINTATHSPSGDNTIYPITDPLNEQKVISFDADGNLYTTHSFYHYTDIMKCVGADPYTLDKVIPINFYNNGYTDACINDEGFFVIAQPGSNKLLEVDQDGVLIRELTTTQSFDRVETIRNDVDYRRSSNTYTDYNEPSGCDTLRGGADDYSYHQYEYMTNVLISRSNPVECIAGGIFTDNFFNDFCYADDSLFSFQLTNILRSLNAATFSFWGSTLIGDVLRTPYDVCSDDPHRFSQTAPQVISLTVSESINYSEIAENKILRVTKSESLVFGEQVNKVFIPSSGHGLSESIIFTEVAEANKKLIAVQESWPLAEYYYYGHYGLSEILGAWNIGTTDMGGGTYWAICVFRMNPGPTVVSATPGFETGFTAFVNGAFRTCRRAWKYDSYYGLTGPDAGLHDNMFVAAFDISAVPLDTPTSWKLAALPSGVLNISPQLYNNTGYPYTGQIDAGPPTNIINSTITDQHLVFNESKTLQDNRFGQTLRDNIDIHEAMRSPIIFRMSELFFFKDSNYDGGTKRKPVAEILHLLEALHENLQYGKSTDTLGFKESQHGPSYWVLSDTSKFAETLRENLYKIGIQDNYSYVETVRPKLIVIRVGEIFKLSEKSTGFTDTLTANDNISYSESISKTGPTYLKQTEKLTYTENIHISPVYITLSEEYKIAESNEAVRMSLGDRLRYSETVTYNHRKVIVVNEWCQYTDRAGRAYTQSISESIIYSQYAGQSFSENISYNESTTYLKTKGKSEALILLETIFLNKRISISVAESQRFRQGLYGFLWDRNLNTYSPYVGVIE